MKRIPLTRGKYAIVDDEDYEKVSKYKWYCAKVVRVNDEPVYYAVKSIWKKGKLRMHRLIMKPTGNKVVDHINGDGLDNRKSNLRLCLNNENLMNRHTKPRSNSGKTGVSFNSRNQKWQAQIGYQGKVWHLGWFSNKEDAFDMRDIAKQIFYPILYSKS